MNGRGPGRPLPPYSGHATELFDDSIDPASVGFDLEGAAPPIGDNVLRERTQVCDAVLLARITTVTLKKEDTGRSWQIGLHTLEKLAGAHPPDADFTLQVDGTGRAAGIMRTFENRLVGTTFVAFLREFAHPGADEGDLHFHLSRDDKDELAAVHAAILLQEVR